MTIFGHFKWMRERVGQVIITLALNFFLEIVYL